MDFVRFCPANSITDAVFLNLPRRTDRREETEKWLGKLGIRKIHWQPALDPITFSRKDGAINPVMSCTLGHYAMFSRVASSSRPWLVIEDDLIPCHDLQERWNKSFLVPTNTELLQLGVSWPKPPEERLMDVCKMSGQCGSFASIITPEGARKLLDCVASSPYIPADHYYALAKINYYVILPTWFIFKDDSDIAARASYSSRLGDVWADHPKNQKS